MRLRWQLFTLFVRLILVGLMVVLAGGRISSSYRAHRHVSLSAISQKKCLKRIYFGSVRSESLCAKSKELDESGPALRPAWYVLRVPIETSSMIEVARSVVVVDRNAWKRTRAPPVAVRV